jgi:DNA-binding transcriptional MerR regulator
MNNFNLKDIENLTGIKAHTLRIWEKRYGNIMPPSSPGQHRQYDNNDLKHILRISSLYHNGIKISRIADMTADEIASSTVNMDEKTNFEVFITRLVEFTLELNEVGFKRLFSELKEMMGEENLYLYVIFPFLSRIGNLWLNGKVVPVQEHFCSNLIRNELLLSIDQITQKTKYNNSEIKVVLFTPETEFHEIPLLFFNLILKKLRFKTIYLGTNCNNHVAEEVIRKTEVNTILIYLITNFTDTSSQEIVNLYNEKFSNLNILYAGPGFRNAVSKQEKTCITGDLNTILNYFKKE